jgi:hypothetical protein
MDIKAVALSESALQGIGRMASPERWSSIPAGTDFLYADTMSDLGLAGTLSSGSLISAPRPMALSRMERHFNTREMVAALEGDAIMCLAPPQEPSGRDLRGIRAVRIRAGDVIVLEMGAWHWIPFPLGSSPAKFLIVFKSGTGTDDLYFCDLEDTREVIGQDAP